MDNIDDVMLQSLATVRLLVIVSCAKRNEIIWRPSILDVNFILCIYRLEKIQSYCITESGVHSLIGMVKKF